MQREVRGNKNGEREMRNLEDRNRDTEDQQTKQMGKEMGQNSGDIGGGTKTQRQNKNKGGGT